MLICRICGCHCDPSDTVNGVCDDCREEQKIEEQNIRFNLMLKSEGRQITLEDFSHEFTKRRSQNFC